MRILFVHQSLQSYVAKDLAILRSKHKVRECEFIGLQKTSPLRLLNDVWTLFKGVLWADLSFSWFGKLHAFFATLFSTMLSKKSIVVAGGDDVAAHTVGDTAYGLCASPIKGWFVTRAFRWADLVLAVSKSNLQETLANTGVEAGKVHLVYHGFDAHQFRRLDGTDKECIVVTVGNVDSENYHRKGLKLFVQTAPALPDVEFYLIGGRFGPTGDETLRLLRENAPNNVTFTGRLAADDFLALLSRSSVYVQASEHEAFGCSLGEAMLCECVPVVHRTLALPEVVGDCGFYVEELTPEQLAEQIVAALDHPELGKRARQRIIEHFPLQQRREQLLQIVDSVVGK